MLTLLPAAVPEVALELVLHPLIVKPLRVIVGKVTWQEVAPLYLVQLALVEPIEVAPFLLKVAVKLVFLVIE